MLWGEASSARPSGDEVISNLTIGDWRIRESLRRRWFTITAWLLAVDEVAAEARVTSAQVALAWILSREMSIACCNSLEASS